jgi:hypothetical protein
MKHFPEERIIHEFTAVRHTRLLPPEAYGEVLVKVGDHVQGPDVIARGGLPQDYQIIDVAGPMRISPTDTETLQSVITLQVGDRVVEGQPLAEERNRRDRKRIPLAPSDGIVRLVEGGQLVLQINPQPIEVQARIPGVIDEVIEDRGAVVESTGSYLQCAWGNGQFAFGTYAFEPPKGLASISSDESLLTHYRGRIYILERPIQPEDFRLVIRHKLGGLVAPAMSYRLREVAMAFKVPIMLTEGFGHYRGTSLIYRILHQFEGKRQAAFDASPPNRWKGEVPGIIIPTSAGSQRITRPAINLPVEPGYSVRLQREPYVGEIALVKDIADQPYTTESGLRVPAAQVKLHTGKHVMVPLANVQMLGKSKPSPQDQ